MRVLVVILTLAFASSVALAHGGGYRKNSPPGQYCHMEAKTGQVHCH